MLILASASKSRKKLLEDSDFQFIQVPSKFDESKIKKNDSKELAQELSEMKAISVMKNLPLIFADLNLKTNLFEILGCDSVFEFNGNTYGKPSSKKDAYSRWKEMSSSYGYLHTGHTILFTSLNYENNEIVLYRKEKKVVSSKVYFSSLSEEEIKQYVESLEPLSSAGGFALEGIGGKYIEKIDGCYSNVLGLSLPWLRKTHKKSSA